MPWCTCGDPVDRPPGQGPTGGATSAAVERRLSPPRTAAAYCRPAAGYVLTPDSLASPVAQFRCCFGRWIGTGRGWIPWIHIADEVGIIMFALQQPAAGGPVNLTAPEPARACEFARSLGRATGHRAWLPVPTLFVRSGLGVVTDILVKGKRIIPARVSALGYQFSFPDLDSALHDPLGRPDDAKAAR